MKVKFYELINAKDLLDDVSARKSIPTKTAYKIYILLSKFNDSLQFFENKRLEFLQIYGEDKDGTLVVPEEKRLEFFKSLNEIGELYCDVEFEKIDIDININLGISPKDFGVLESFFNFVE